LTAGDDSFATQEHIKARKLRPLAVTIATRWRHAERADRGRTRAGLRSDSLAWYRAPKNTPTEIVDKLKNEINAAIANPRIKARFAELGNMVLPTSPSDFEKLVAEETRKWGKVISAANIKAD
jgi:tripartite-type tricarboxylate transporter receptor subunit TctC